MKRFLLLASLFPLTAYADEPRGAEVAFENCVIAAKHSDDDGTLSKVYKCGDDSVLLQGLWSETNGHRKEFGHFFSGESGDFKTTPIGKVRAFSECTEQSENGNTPNYMDEILRFTCGKKRIALHGQWGDEYQGNWEYSTLLGEAHIEPRWVDDPKKNIDFISAFQKWCPTKYGYKICGWKDEPKVDHGVAPPYKRD